MKNQTSPLDDLKHIRQMMEESTKFLSLSGLSGVAVGCFALLGSAIAYFFILDKGMVSYDEFLRVVQGGWFNHFRLYMILDALFVLAGALASAWYITYRKGKHHGQRFWTPSAKKMVGSLSSILAIGGMFCAILMVQGYGKLLASAMLLFYGMALLNAAKYSKQDIRTLGYTEIVLGLTAAVFLNHGLLIWTIGFGIVHIVYGTVMYYKYDR